MAELQIFPLTSGQGYGAVIHGNFVTVCTGFRGFSASVAAFQLDGNHQYETFETAAAAAEWAVLAASTHQGKPHQISKIEYWEVRKGYSIEISRLDAGGYEAETFPMWVDSDHMEPMRNFKAFSTTEEAIEWARLSADEQSRHDDDHARTIQQIREALELASS